MLLGTRLGTNKFESAKAFYDQLAPLLDARPVIEGKGLVGYKGPMGGIFMVGTPLEGEATTGNGTMIMLAAASRAAVDAVHAKAIELGGTCEGAPGARGGDFYEAFFRDLDGNKIMVGGEGIR